MANAHQIVDELVSKLSIFLSRPTPFLGAVGLPAKLADGAPYQGTNTLLLLIEQITKGFESNLWGGIAALRDANNALQKGERATFAIYAGSERVDDDKPVELDSMGKPKYDEDGKYRRVFRSITLFNECQGASFEKLDRAPLPSGNSQEICEYSMQLRDEVAFRQAIPPQERVIPQNLTEGDVNFIVNLASHFRAIQKGFCLNREFPPDAILAAGMSGNHLMMLCGTVKQLVDPSQWKMPAQKLIAAIAAPEIQGPPVVLEPPPAVKPVVKKATLSDWPCLQGKKTVAPAQPVKKEPPAPTGGVSLDW